MIVVSDTSAISNLIVIDKLEILESVFKKILIPTKVYEEIIELKNFGVLIKAKEMKIISNVKEVLDQLKTEANFYISNDLYSEILNTVNE